MFRLATGEHTEQEAEADGDGNCRQRVAPDGGFSLVGGVHRFVLGAVDLLVGDAAHGRAQVLQIGADRVDLIRKLLRFGGGGRHGASFLGNAWGRGIGNSGRERFVPRKRPSRLILLVRASLLSSERFAAKPASSALMVEGALRPAHQPSSLSW